MRPKIKIIATWRDGHLVPKIVEVEGDNSVQVVRENINGHEAIHLIVVDNKVICRPDNSDYDFWEAQKEQGGFVGGP